MAEIKITGYADQISVKQGDTISFMTSVEGTASVQADFVRLIHGDEHPDGPGFIEREMACDANKKYRVKKQYVQTGSFLTIEDNNQILDLSGSFTLYAFIFPTAPHLHRQGILMRWSIQDQKGYALGINDEGKLEFWTGNGKKTDKVYAEAPLSHLMWYFVAVSYDRATGEAVLFQEPVVNSYNSLLSPMLPLDYACHVREKLRVEPAGGDIPFLIAGCNDYNKGRGPFVSQVYNGKIDRCGIQDRALSRDELTQICNGEKPFQDSLITHWDTTIGYTDQGIGDEVMDTGPHQLHGQGINRPIRCMTGYNWNGKDDSFRIAPEQYGGVHFHDDALIDCKWEPMLTTTIPDSFKSGCYALRVRAGDAEDHIPFVVRAAKPKAKIAMLMPTASYLAYANERLAFEFHTAQSITAHTPVLTKYDVELYKKDDYGLSTYDYFNDGMGCCYSSYRRPIFNLRPKHRTAPIAIPWGFPADLSIVGWLEHSEYDFEVITDEDLHRDGLAAIEPYNVIINGAHPEYYSEKMLDAVESYLATGGRLMYIGGNGYYWVTSFRDDEPWCMEVRKGESGSRAWQARPGEYYHATSGERGGLWKNRGRPPQKLTGVGFTSEGMDKSMPYLRMPDSYHKTASWIFDGISDEEPIGDFGLALGGAAGIETDRYELMLGTPPHTKILASSEMFSDYWMHVQEEILYNYPGLRGSEDYQIRADMIYFTTRNNGAVFCSGSIAFGHALPYNNFDNNISTLMANVVNAFEKDGELPGMQYIAKEKHWE